MNVNIGNKVFRLILGDSDFFVDCLKSVDKLGDSTAKVERMTECFQAMIGPWPKHWGLAWYGLRTIFIRSDAPDLASVIAHEFGHIMAYEVGVNDDHQAQETFANLASILLQQYRYLAGEIDAAEYHHPLYTTP